MRLRASRANQDSGAARAPLSFYSTPAGSRVPVSPLGQAEFPNGGATVIGCAPLTEDKRSNLRLATRASRL